MKSIACVSFRCDTDLDRQVRTEAAKKDMNRSEFILEALMEKLGRIRRSRADAEDAGWHGDQT